MKKSEVPQDKDFLIEGKVRDVLYVLDEDGNYTEAHSLGWQPKNDAIKQAWEIVYEKIDKAREEVIVGKSSPVKYFMEKSIMDIKLLSQFSGFSKRRIRKHFKPVVFNNLKRDILEKYAEIFKITVDELIDIGKIKEDKNKK